MSEATNFIVNQNSEVYYQSNYWNDYDVVNGYINHQISGNRHRNCWGHFQHITNNKVFKKALILNCGNGWVERELMEMGLIKEAVGIDYSQDLVNEATEKANGAPLRYYVTDTNKAQFPEDGYDLVINHAAVHHIAYLDKVFLKLCEILPSDGYFVSMDFVGPHRNQYPIEQWDAAWELNQRLPAHLRQEMKYPHLPTMLATDPTEAIHSELIIETMKRFFHIEQHNKVGGALAYLLLTFNDNMKKANKAEAEEWINFILREDKMFLLKNNSSSMFDFIVARPNKTILNESKKIKEILKAEEERENTAAKNGGVYYEQNKIQSFYLEMENIKNKNLGFEKYFKDFVR